MPEAGRTPTPQIKQGDSLAWGEAAAANALMHLAPTTDDSVVDEVTYQPQGDEDEFLFGSTIRPNEPITAGAPFGEGPDAILGVGDGRSRLKSFASHVRSDPQATPAAKRFADRVMRGE